MKLPNTLYVKIDDSDKDSVWFSAEDSLDGAVSDDGPTDVGVYRLVEVKRVQKVTQIIKTSKPAPTRRGARDGRQPRAALKAVGD